MSRALVSVVIPTFNYGHFVIEAVDSALAQTYPDVEVIVVDDGSVDDTRERLSAYYNRITYIYQDNAGLSAARNTGVKNARGDWIALLDADDVWHPEKLERQLGAAAAESSVMLIGSPPTRVLPERLPEDVRTEELSVEAFLLTAPVCPSGTLVRKECFASVGYFDETLTSVEDRDMWLRIAARYRCMVVYTPCCWYRPHPGQMSANARRMHSNYKKVLDKFFTGNPQFTTFRRKAYAYMFADTAWCMYAAGERLAALYASLRSWAYCPVSIGDKKRPRFVRAKVFLRALLGDALLRQLYHCVYAGSPAYGDSGSRGRRH